MLFLLLATVRILWRCYKLVVPCGRELLNSACELPLIVLAIALLLRYGLPLHDLAKWRVYWYETLSNGTEAFLASTRNSTEPTLSNATETVLASTRNSTELTLYTWLNALHWLAPRV